MVSHIPLLSKSYLLPWAIDRTVLTKHWVQRVENASTSSGEDSNSEDPEDTLDQIVAAAITE